MKSKGFTLIELLAVIVILAIIAVIATPIILGVIDDAKKSAANSGAYGVLDSARAYYTTSQITPNPKTLPLTITFPNVPQDFTMNGKKPTAGTIVLNADGSYTITGLVIDGYNCPYTNQEFNCN